MLKRFTEHRIGSDVDDQVMKCRQRPDRLIEWAPSYDVDPYLVGYEVLEEDLVRMSCKAEKAVAQTATNGAVEATDQC